MPDRTGAGQSELGPRGKAHVEGAIGLASSPWGGGSIKSLALFEKIA
jgi:hypothetical protein